MFVGKSEKNLLKFKTKKDGLARILHIFKGGREVNNVDTPPLFIQILSQIILPLFSL
jgi:hypothetical protein